MEKFGVGELFLKEITCAQYIFAKKYSKKNCNIEKYYCNLKELFSILIYYKM